MGISSPLLKQAGFVRCKVADAVETAIQWVAEFDGVAQCWQLETPILVGDGDDYEIGYDLKRYDSGNLLYLFGYSAGSENSYHRLALSSGSNQALYGLGFAGQALSLVGSGRLVVKRVNGTLTAKFNNKIATTYETQKVTLDRIGGPWAISSSGYLDGWIENFYFKLNGVEVLRIPLNNKDQGNIQLPTVGNISAFVTNYTYAIWKDKATT